MTESMLHELTFLHRSRHRDRTVEWLWEGYLARRFVTLLVSLWKAGKTTLLSVLLSRMREGGEFLGRTLAAGRAAVVTEEAEELWHERDRLLGLDPHVGFYFQPVVGLPSREQWDSVIQSLLRDRRKHGIDLVVIDTLAAFLPAGAENCRDVMVRTMGSLRTLTAEGMSVLLVHHPRKQPSEILASARGTGALCGHSDIILELKSVMRPSLNDRRRRLIAMARHAKTLSDIVIELNDAGDDYLVHGSFDEEETRSRWPTVRRILEAAERKLTRKQILAQWPDPVRPNEVTLWRCLESALLRGRVLRDGKGIGGDPFRYWLADREVQRVFEFDLPPQGPLEPLYEEVLRPIPSNRPVGTDPT